MLRRKDHDQAFRDLVPPDAIVMTPHEVLRAATVQRAILRVMDLGPVVCYGKPRSEL